MLLFVIMAGVTFCCFDEITPGTGGCSASVGGISFGFLKGNYNIGYPTLLNHYNVIEISFSQYP
jgi:hypothetical protein